MATGRRVLWHSAAPWHPTGYGVQTAMFCSRMQQAGHQVAVLANHGLHGSALEWGDGIPVFPADDVHGMKFVGPVAAKHRADVVISLMDVWPLNPRVFDGVNHAAWVPVDHAPCPPKVARFFQSGRSRAVAMSRFGENALREQGLDPLYVPHGVDTSVFRPMGNREEMRRLMGAPDGAFIVGMVANNAGNTPSRKGFPEALAAFAKFRETHEDAFLWLHTCVSGDRPGGVAGLNLPLLCELLEIPKESVGWPNQTEYDLGIPDGYVAAMYGALDVLMNPAYGEGFGVPIIEAQACGTPVIVSDWTSMPELCGAGWLVGGEPWFDAGHYAYFLHPFVSEIADRLEEAYQARDDRVLRDRAREFALGYDADVVMRDFWAPALEALCEPREVPPLPNRAMRRAMRKAA